MKFLLIAVGLVVGWMLLQRLFGGPRVSPADAAARVSAGTAVVVDVREPSEWASGSVAGAALLPLSDLRGARHQWAPFLKRHAGKELILYCRSGARSGSAAHTLASEGFKTLNAGGYADWVRAGITRVKSGEE
jgi:rhodanese-related sulfurtransferase